MQATGAFRERLTRYMPHLRHAPPLPWRRALRAQAYFTTHAARTGTPQKNRTQIRWTGTLSTLRKPRPMAKE